MSPLFFDDTTSEVCTDISITQFDGIVEPVEMFTVQLESQDSEVVFIRMSVPVSIIDNTSKTEWMYIPHV